MTDIYRSHDVSLLSRRVDLVQDLEVAEARRAKIREKIGDVDRELREARRPERRRRMGRAIIASVVLALGGGMTCLALLRHYPHRNKTNEPKNTIGAISRDARAAFDRDGKLCPSAPPVPVEGVRSKHMPEADEFEAPGWKCLRFAITTPHYFRYHYNVGGGYLGPRVGGPDPGPHGFEVAAEGDLDGDGNTSLYTRVGWIDQQTGELVMSRELFTNDPYE